MSDSPGWFGELLKGAWKLALETFDILTPDELIAYGLHLTGADQVLGGKKAGDLWDETLRGIIAALPEIEGLDTILEAAVAKGFPLDLMCVEITYLSWIMAQIQQRIEIAAVPVQYELAREMRIARPDPTIAWTMVWRAGGDPAVLKAMLADQGWSDDLIEKYERVVRPILSLSEGVELARRGQIGVDELGVALHRQGYSDTDRDDLLTLVNRIPGPGDLISMAVREAFHPELVAKYHYMDRFPPEFAHWMNKQGFTRDWAEKWWVAHWRLPSIGDAFEMLHRGEIGEPEVKDLLMTADIAPIWHKPLIAIAYAPYTRVDVRRMHKTGVIDDAGLVRAYRDVGFDLEKATKMAEFTIAYNMESEVEATKGEILKGYRLGVLTYSEGLSGLLAINVSESLARYYLSMEDYKHAQNLAEEEITTTGELYVAGQISKGEAYGRLNALGLSAERVERLFTTWDIRIERKITIPSKGELETFFKEDIIDGTVYKDQLERRGYSGTYIEWYYTHLLIEVEIESREAEEKAAKEAERVREATEKTVYQEAKAEITYSIAQLRAHHTEIRVAIERQLAAPERRRMMEVIEASTLEIARINREVGEKRAELATAKARLTVLTVLPEVLTSYDLIDNADIQMAELRATIADLQVIKRQAQAAIRVARIGTEVAEQRVTIEAIKVDIAMEKADVDELKLIIAGARSELAEAWTAEDIAHLEDELRSIELKIRELESERARLRLTV